MFQRLQALLSGADLESNSQEKHPDEDLRLATAALLVEAAMMDGQTGGAELKTVESLLAEHFGLTDEEVVLLVEAGQAAATDSSQLYGFTRVIKDRYSQEERIRMIEMLWEVAYIDGQIHHLESNLIRRVAGLIYVPDRENGDARKRVREKLGKNHDLTA